MGMCNSKNDIIAEIVNENEELRKQVKYLKDVLNDKKKEKPRLKKVGMKLETPISKEAIEKYVEKILENKDMNISYLPDFVEKKIYENVFSITLNLLDDIIIPSSDVILPLFFPITLLPSSNISTSEISKLNSLSANKFEINKLDKKITNTKKRNLFCIYFIH